MDELALALARTRGMLIRAACDDHQMRCGCRGEQCELGAAIAAYNLAWLDDRDRRKVSGSDEEALAPKPE